MVHLSTIALTGVAVLFTAPLVSAHGYVSSITIGSTNYTGYLEDVYPYESSPPKTIAWANTATDLGFEDGAEYAGPNIICHRNATPGALTANATAGAKVVFQWTTWPSSHHGPIINYLANCNGDCSTVDKTTLKFVKFDATGLINDATPPGTWATDDLIAAGNQYSLTLPTSIAPGNYVLRHEIIALHSAGQTDGAQNYPQCFNIAISGSGTATPTGTLGEQLYKDTDPGILIDIYEAISNYTIPGPALWTGS
ncbi:glycoside hydrolase [Talaromyces proteolyticus]|uniref:Glycoside hydrolase n=1 Tax=Talaromyces proteolyticus TaxID=1131652 RepID=A0AAD4KI65_9EURO|nr:glycoside hydrolase [Talaromyces proteolyticus]KAH8689018.1 glycoside hydrolase [Talaromyces proteolyticus]